MKKIYIAKKWQKENPTEFITSLIDNNKFPTTYKDKNNKNMQCKQGKARSIGDIVNLVQTYYLETEEKEIFKIIYNHLLSNNILKPLIYCDNIKKLVLYKQILGDYKKNWLFNNRVFDYSNYMKYKNWELEDHITIEYFLESVGFTKEEIKKELV